MSYRYQKGLTLIELMMASTLGLIASYFIMNIMITSARTAHLSEGISQSQETGRLVMSWLKDSVINAGYESNYLNEESPEPLMSVCTGATTPPADNANCIFDTDLNANAGDRLAIRRTAGGLNPSTRDIQTCGGEALAASIINGQEEVSDVFWVSLNTADTDTSNDYQFQCVTYDKDGNRLGTAQTIANGIESMQILVGIGDSEGNVTNFVSPSDVTDWKSVVGVRIALLAREFGNSTLEDERRIYGLLNSEPIEFKDRTARYVQNGTIWFPNSKKM
ncbi:PilW family protein [Thalassolituus sp. LLYu03]|uniref:PilW family protein n=1 Tax=Thalassolituus sp. LLYu03 TaxID=3421656 RepID=UPI003D286500